MTNSQMAGNQKWFPALFFVLKCKFFANMIKNFLTKRRKR